MKKIFNTIAAYLLLILPLAVSAQIPRTLSYQGVLTDNTGKPRAEGNYAFTFRLYDIASGGTAIWSEQKTLSIKGGLFSTALGDQTPFGPAVKFDRPYWLGIQVGNEPELAQRIPLTSVGYSMSSLRADTAMIAMVALPSSSDTTWRVSGENVYRLNGNVGVGAMQPDIKFVVDRGNTAGYVMRTQGVNGYNLWFGNYNGYSQIQSDQAGVGPQNLTINPNGGNVGIGTTNPLDNLDVAGGIAGQNLSIKGVTHPAIRMVNSNGNGDYRWEVGPGGDFYLYNQIAQAYRLYISPGGAVGIGTNNPQYPLDVNGRTRTKVLEISGGADLAEPFEMSHTEPLPAGVLVVIDKDNPGKLKLATEAYDKRVAGVISGAGGINPGLTLAQEGKLDGGQHVALSGKVYALATASNGPIEPGDLLTTSNIPGRAMKAADQVRWPGAVIGKAMSSLNEGEGLVLVLVNLQ